MTGGVGRVKTGSATGGGAVLISRGTLGAITSASSFVDFDAHGLISSSLSPSFRLSSAALGFVVMVKLGVVSAASTRLLRPICWKSGTFTHRIRHYECTESNHRKNVRRVVSRSGCEEILIRFGHYHCNECTHSPLPLVLVSDWWDNGLVLLRLVLRFISSQLQRWGRSPEILYSWYPLLQPTKL